MVLFAQIKPSTCAITQPSPSFLLGNSPLGFLANVSSKKDPTAMNPVEGHTFRSAFVSAEGQPTKLTLSEVRITSSDMEQLLAQLMPGR